MTEFSFGQSPTSDTCDAIEIPCVYDEVLGEDMPLDKWFEVGGGTPLFSLIKTPVLFKDLKEKEFSSLETLAIAPENDGGEDKVWPREVILDINYY